MLCDNYFTVSNPADGVSLNARTLFHRFSSDDTKMSGNGLGLSIVKAIMDAHKQPFGVYNTAEGVAFWFCLKKAPKEETDVQENENDTGSME